MPSVTLTLAVVVNPALIPDGDLGPLMERLENFGPELDLLGEIMQVYEQASFADQGATLGAPWADLKPSTVAQKRHLNLSSAPLVRTGDLRAAVGQSILVSGNSVTTGIDLAAVPYAEYQDRRRVLVSIVPEEIDDLKLALQAYLSDALGLPPGAIDVVET